MIKTEEMEFMNRIEFSREGEILPAAVVGVGLVLSAIAFAVNTPEEYLAPRREALDRWRVVKESA